MTGVVRRAAGCQRSLGGATGGERSPLACWYCAGTPASSPATQQRTHREKCENRWWQKWQKVENGIQRERTPVQRWEARLVTSEPWECPVGAREVSSSAGCWCSPAVLQPCSLSHPRPASYTQRRRRWRYYVFEESHYNNNSNNNTHSHFKDKVCGCKHDGHKDFVLHNCFTRGC